MLKYMLSQNQNKKNSKSYGKWYARAVVSETVGLDQLAQHMSQHNSPFSEGSIYGILKDMVKCIHEIVLEGKAVKIPDLAIFSIGLNSTGSLSVREFSPQKNITGYRLRSRATGAFTVGQLSNEARVAEQKFYDVAPEPIEDEDTETGGEG